MLLPRSNAPALERHLDDSASIVWGTQSVRATFRRSPLEKSKYSKTTILATFMV
jgi:hypothetical protein